VEWCKARARMLRWKEEVLLLQEEMRRTSASLDGLAAEWEERASNVWGPEGLHDGQRGYALRQAAIRRRIKSTFEARWSRRPIADLPVASDDPTAILSIFKLAKASKPAQRDDELIEVMGDIIRDAMDGQVDDNVFVERDTD
jgi:hypothetical protein